VEIVMKRRSRRRKRSRRRGRRGSRIIQDLV
jgi:hypothetical protein